MNLVDTLKNKEVNVSVLCYVIIVDTVWGIDHHMRDFS